MRVRARGWAGAGAGTADLSLYLRCTYDVLTMYHAPRNRVHVPGFGFQISPIIAGVFRLTCDNSRNAEWQHTCKCNCVARSRWVPGGAGPAAEPHRAFRSALTRGGGGAVVRWWCNPNPATRSMHPATRPRLPVARCRVRRVAALRRCGWRCVALRRCVARRSRNLFI